MNIESKEIALSVVTVKLDSKKITNVILDQITRLDLCSLLVDEDGNYDNSKRIVPVCRFSLHHLLNSEIRIYKTKGYPTGSIEHHIGSFSYQDEAYFFTYQGQLYCGSYSKTTGTLEYGNIHNKLGDKVSDLDRKIKAARKIIDLHIQGLEPIKIIAQCYSFSTPLPRRNKPQRALSLLEGWDDDILGFDASPEEQATHELTIITKNHGGWEQYIDSLKQAEAADKKLREQCESVLDAYTSNVSKVIKEIMDSPFAVLGL